MSYSTNVVEARKLAEKMHQGAMDKAGMPYIHHPERVASRLQGWLHDVVEDTSVTLQDIETLFGADTAKALDAVTHRKDEPWQDYLCRVKANPIATAVKISDLIDNSNLSRLPSVTMKDVKRQEKYNKAL